MKEHEFTVLLTEQSEIVLYAKTIKDVKRKIVEGDYFVTSKQNNYANPIIIDKGKESEVETDE
jgi:hypothetical protein